MSNQGKSVVGIWMDQKHAIVISTPNRKPNGTYEMIKKIERGDHSNDVYKNESAELKKDTAETKKYHKAIIAEIDQADAIYIFGPGKAQEELKNVLSDMHQFKSKHIELGTSDKMSVNQMIARVRDHFDGK
jgi:hypothetical protein